MANKNAEVRRILDQVKSEGRTSLTAPEGKLVCDAYGIAVPKEGVASSAADATRMATAMGYPVVLKIVSPEILHKTEAGGVILGVKSAAEVEAGIATIMANAARYNPKATLLGVQVQQMLSGGQEVIIGAVTDPAFGKLVAFGLGGILVEVLKDITFRLAPATNDVSAPPLARVWSVSLGGMTLLAAVLAAEAVWFGVHLATEGLVRFLP